MDMKSRSEINIISHKNTTPPTADLKENMTICQQPSLLPSSIHLHDDSNENRTVFNEQKMISEDILELVEYCCKESPKSLTTSQRSQIMEFLAELDIKEENGETNYFRVYEHNEKCSQTENVSLPSVNTEANEVSKEIESPQMKEMKNLFGDDDDSLQKSEQGLECTSEACDVLDFALNLYLPPKYNLMTIQIPETHSDTDTSHNWTNVDSVDHLDILQCGDNCLPCGSPTNSKESNRLAWSNKKKKAAEQMESYMSIIDNEGYDSIDDIPAVFQQFFIETSPNLGVYSRIMGGAHRITFNDEELTARRNTDSTTNDESNACNNVNEDIPHTQSAYLAWDNETNSADLFTNWENSDEEDDYQRFFMGIQNISSNLLLHQEENNNSSPNTNDASIQTGEDIYNPGSNEIPIFERGSTHYIVEPILPTEQLEPVTTPTDIQDIPISLFPQSVDECSTFSDESDDDSLSSSTKQEILDNSDAEESIPYDPDVFYTYFTANLLKMPDGQLPPRVEIDFGENKLP